jgi:hypothetical protein
MTQLQRLVLDFRGDEETVIRCLYRSSLDGPNPNTKARAREVSELTRAGLQNTLRALSEGEATMCGTSGYTTREDLLVLDTKDATTLACSKAEGSAA